MGIKEAIEWFENSICEEHINCPECEAAKVALAALEKQVPKPLSEELIEEGLLKGDKKLSCPNCKTYLALNKSGYKYCSNCGQRLKGDNECGNDKRTIRKS